MIKELRAGDRVGIAQGVQKQHNKSRKIYCAANDIVKIIAIHGNQGSDDCVLIVEGRGERYSIKQSETYDLSHVNYPKK